MSAPEAWPWIGQRLLERLPELVLCGPEHWKLRRRPKAEIGQHRIAQLNTYGWVTCMDLDCDDEDATRIVRDPALPPWSWLVHSRRTGHLHAGWLFEVPVNNRRRRPRVLLDEVHTRLRAQVGSDPRHHGRGPVPNPLFIGDGGSAQATEWGSAAPMRCADFLEWLDATEALLDVPLAEGLPLTGAGRNVSLFHAVRHEAGEAVRTADRQRWSARRWAAHVEAIAQRHNTDGLGPRELRATARSIARWTWQHRRDRRGGFLPFDEWQRKNGQRSGRARRARTWARDQEILKLRREGLSVRAVARRLECSVGAVSRVVGRRSRS